MSDEICSASDEEIARWHEVAADVRNRHASEIPNRFISMDIRLTGLLELLARIEQDRATIAALSAFILRLMHDMNTSQIFEAQALLSRAASATRADAAREAGKS